MKQQQLIQLTTARKVSAALAKNLSEAIEKKFGAAQIEFLVDVTLIGGVKLTIDSIEYDGSVRSKLSQLKQQMLINSIQA